MTLVEGLGTRFNFPDYIARRPATAIHACAMLADVIRHYHEEGNEMPFAVPPFGVLMYLEMLGMLKTLAPRGVVFAIEVPPQVKKWM